MKTAIHLLSSDAKVVSKTADMEPKSLKPEVVVNYSSSCLIFLSIKKLESLLVCREELPGPEVRRGL